MAKKLSGDVPLSEDILLIELGAKIGRVRLAREMTQAELARKSGLDISTISDIENGRRNPSVLVLAKIAAAISAQVVELFGPATASDAPLRAIAARVDLLTSVLLRQAKLTAAEKTALQAGRAPQAARSSDRPRRAAK